MKAGSYLIVRQPKARARWKVATVAEFEPCWVVRFRLPGWPVKVESSRLGLCEGCLACVGNPVQERERCACLRPVWQWADAKLAGMARLWQQGRLDELRAVGAPRSVPSVGVLVDTYLAQVPAGGSHKENVMDLLAILEQVTGKDRDGVRRLPVSVLSKETAVAWLTMRWHANRDKERPEKERRTWDALREAYALGRLEAPPRNVASPGNYTINGMLNKVRAVIGKTARTHYLRGLELPALTFEEVSGLVAARATHKPLGEDVRGLLRAAAGAALESGERDFWIAMQLASRCGMRPVEVLAARRSWLVRDGDRWLLDVRNREGFQQKARARAVWAQYELPAEVAEVLAVEPAGVSGSEDWHLFAPGLSATGRDVLLRRTYSQRLRQWITEGKDTWYSLRKLFLSVVYEGAGKEAASRAARHASSDVIEAHYANPLKSVPAVDALQCETRPAS